MPTLRKKARKTQQPSISPSSSADNDDETVARGHSVSFDETGSGESITESHKRRDIPSGLSALIQAATAQLADLIEEEKTRAARQNIESCKENHQHLRAVSASSHGGLTQDDAKDDPDRKSDNPSKPSANTTPLMLPEQPDASKAKTFPTILMSLALDPNNEDIIAFLPDGKFFATRAKKFTDELMPKYFECSSWQEFLLLLHDWGFSRILHEVDNHPPSPTAEPKSDYEEDMVINVEVFRHPKFIKGEWKLCEAIRFGESPTDARLSALPEKAMFEYKAPPTEKVENPPSFSLSSPGQQSKRRLSPSSSTMRRRNSDFITTSVSSQHIMKKRMSWDGSLTRFGSDHLVQSSSGDELDHSGRHRSGRSDEIRSFAHALTSEKLNLRTSGSRNVGGKVTSSTNSPINSKRVARAPLVDQALQSATHTIVTDAIETLLHDEYHTKETYLKHSRELSRSSLPGVVPISKQLFEQQQAAGVSSSSGMTTKLLPSEETASAIMAAAIEVEQRAHATSSYAFTTQGKK